MCGICGVINFNQSSVDPQQINLMMLRMKHRGPNDQGTYFAGNIGLGFVRLSILDLSDAGHQPMTDKTGRYTIIYNGEIFNYIELREELQKKGCTFRSDSDTEVILNAYIVWGEDSLHRFNGMWAFAIYDKMDHSMFFARDRFGIKPFYYYLDSDIFVFASEIPAILSALKRQPQKNEEAIYEFLLYNRTDVTNNTFFKGIKRLNHGYKLKFKYEKIFEEQWYSLSENLKKPFISPEDYLDMFSSSVNLRLRSDVPVGICLSGGLDSSTIAMTVSRILGHPNLNTFSAVYGNNEKGDENKFIQVLAPYLSNMHYTTPTADSLFVDMMDFITTHSEPVPSTSPYAQYKVMQLANNFVTVTLDGQGADEQLAGYHYFYGFYFKSLHRNYQFIKLGKSIKEYLDIHSSLYAIWTFLYFLIPKRMQSYLRFMTKGYMNRDFFYQHCKQDNVVDTIYSSNSLSEALIDHFENKLEHLLKWEDRNSMRFSIEARVPFLDHRLVERTLPLGTEMLINSGFTKHILRAATVNVLPDEIRWRRDKMGFETPQDKWFREEKFRKLVEGIIYNDKCKISEYVNLQACRVDYQKHLSNKINIGNEIWKWINLEFWLEFFFK